MKTHAKNGEYMPAFPKYGYIKDPEDKHHLVIDPEAAEIVKLIFTMAADGKTKGQIAKYLNETHVLTCREYMCRKGIKMHRENEKEKKLWSVTTISDMLKNEVYLGKIIWNKKRVARTGSNKLVWEGGSTSQFSPVMIFKLWEKFSDTCLEVFESMEVNGKRTFGYDVPIVYKRV